MSWLIKGALIVPLAGEKPWFTGDIAVIDDKIAAIGDDLTPAYNDLKKIPAQGFIAMPGLINAHTHIVMNLLRGCGDDMPLEDWLSKRIFPLENRLTADTARAGAMSGVLEMLASGVTAFCDSYFFMDEVAKAALQSGMRANLSRGLTDSGGGGAERLREGVALVKNWDGQGGGRIKVWLSPHAPYTCGDSYLREIEAEAAELGVGLNIHVAETRREVDDSLAAYGKTPVERLNDLSLFDRVPTLAAHCVWLSPADQAILRQKGVAVVHNPQSNLKLGSGIGPIPALLAAGVPVALGTDGAASNNNLDLWEEIRAAALIHKGAGQDPTLMPAAAVLRVACPAGAAAIGFPECGTLEVGKKADILLVDIDRPNMRPLLDPLSQLVYSAGALNVDTVLIDGRLVLRRQEFLTLDQERILAEAQAAAEKLFGGDTWVAV
ncbi:MAG: amidohydrolase [Peptococcaceae bacterium]|jgi:5-methylthioadenosine/S-adenosylhomocysteine deaminase|nr:amidohydrolase [Peptococcaceae bacterium]